MNKSGLAAKKYVTSVKKAEKLIVVYDDMDLPLGSLKISFGRGSGGHRGIESLVRSLRTKNFIRIRVGIVPTTPTGKLKKPKGENKVLDFIMGEFKKPELEILKKVNKQAVQVIEVLVTEGREKAMNQFN